MHLRTENTRLLKDSIAVDPIVMIKQTTLPVSQRLGTNVLQVFTDQEYNPATGQYESVVRYERQITFADWNEFDTSLNDLHISEIPREFGHNWAGSEEISGVLSSMAATWNHFTELSSWQQERPDNVQFFSVSGDNNWWYRKTTDFADGLGNWNPSEDWGGAWELYFSANSAAEQEHVMNKIEVVDQLFEALEIF